MSQILSGMRVHDVRGRTLGAVVAVFPCCIEIVGGRHIQRNAIFNITESGAELVCDGNQVDRYACLVHRPAIPAS